MCAWRATGLSFGLTKETKELERAHYSLLHIRWANQQGIDRLAHSLRVPLASREPCSTHICPRECVYSHLVLVIPLQIDRRAIENEQCGINEENDPGFRWCSTYLQALRRARWTSGRAAAAQRCSSAPHTQAHTNVLHTHRPGACSSARVLNRARAQSRACSSKQHGSSSSSARPQQRAWQ